MAKIELTNLTKKWGDFVGVDNFNLTIKDKEFLVLLVHQVVVKQLQ